MQEVVYRRYKDYEELPSLVIIDGGKGQLSSALEVIRGLVCMNFLLLAWLNGKKKYLQRVRLKVSYWIEILLLFI